MYYGNRTLFYYILFLIAFFIFTNIILYFFGDFISFRKYNLRISDLNVERILNPKSDINIEPILDKDCNPNLLNISEQCLNSMKKIDRFETLKIINNQRLNYDFKYRSILKYHHVFWAISAKTSNLGRVLKLNLISYLGTQNLVETKFILWKLENFPKDLEEEIVKKFKFYIDNNMIELKIFDLTEFCTKNSLLERSGNCKDILNFRNSIINSNAVGLSDFVRFIVLLKYGGFYTDGDTMYLRNFEPLWNLNFVYRWSYINKFNTAIVGINNITDPTFLKLMDDLLFESNYALSAFHPHFMSSKLAQVNHGSIFNFKYLKVLHSSLFDPAWLCFDGIEPQRNPLYNCGFSQFSDRKHLDAKDFDPNKYFEGAFAYHMHLGYVANVINESYFSHFENYFSDVLNL